MTEMFDVKTLQHTKKNKIISFNIKCNYFILSFVKLSHKLTMLVVKETIRGDVTCPPLVWEGWGLFGPWMRQ